MKNFKSLKLKNNTTGLVKKDTLDGKEYLVAPVVMIREGVLNEFLYPAEDLEFSAGGWNGRPVVAPDHPVDDENHPTGAGTKKIIEEQTIGVLMNTQYDDSIKGLRADAWIDIEKCQRICPIILERLLSDDPEKNHIDVSTGMFTDDEEKSGTYDGVDYKAICHSIVPDHLAVLPFCAGACSWDDGAGIPRINKTQKEHKQMKKKLELLVNSGKLSQEQAVKINALGDEIDPLLDAVPEEDEVLVATPETLEEAEELLPDEEKEKLAELRRKACGLDPDDFDDPLDDTPMTMQQMRAKLCKEDQAEFDAAMDALKKQRANEKAERDDMEQELMDSNPELEEEEVKGLSLSTLRALCKVNRGRDYRALNPMHINNANEVPDAPSIDSFLNK